MKTYIWSLPTRLFHWLLVVGLIGAYILAESETNLNLHTAFGYMVGAAVIFRIIWGFAGPKYSRFSDFNFNPLKAVNYVLHKDKNENEAGHNPAAAPIMFLIVLFSGLLAISGILLLAAKGTGFFAFLNTGIDKHTLKEFHEAMFSVVAGLTVVHLLGNVHEYIFNRKRNTQLSMFNGYKTMDAQGIKLNPAQKVFSIIGIIAVLSVLPYTIAYQDIKKADKKAGINAVESTGQDQDEHEEQNEDDD